MAEKMTRRTFMKSAAAAAAAISFGVLTGCGGSGQLADDEVQIGPFTVKVFGLDVDLGTESGTDKGAITGKVRLRYDAGGGGSWQGGQYGDMFQAFVGEAKLSRYPRRDFLCLRHAVGQALCHRGKRSEAELPRCRNQGSLPESSACGAEDRHQGHQRDAVPCSRRMAAMQPPRLCLPLPRFTRRPLCPSIL